GWQDIAAEGVGPARAEGKLVASREDEIGLAEHPVVGEFPGRRGIFLVPLRRAAIDPRGERLDFVVSQTALVVERVLVGRRLPRRYLAISGCSFASLGPRHRLFVGHQAERSDFTWPVANLAVLLQDRGDILVIRDLGRRFHDGVAAADGAADGLGYRR